MNDRFQAGTPRPASAPVRNFDDEPRFAAPRPRPATPLWVWLAIGLPLVFMAACGGAALLVGMLWLGYSDFDLPAPSDPPIIEVIEPDDAP